MPLTVIAHQRLVPVPDPAGISVALQRGQGNQLGGFWMGGVEDTGGPSAYGHLVEVLARVTQLLLLERVLAAVVAEGDLTGITWKV